MSLEMNVPFPYNHQVRPFCPKVQHGNGSWTMPNSPLRFHVLVHSLCWYLAHFDLRIWPNWWLFVLELVKICVFCIKLHIGQALTRKWSCIPLSKSELIRRFEDPCVPLWKFGSNQRSADPCISFSKFRPVRQSVDSYIPLEKSELIRRFVDPCIPLRKSDRFSGSRIPTSRFKNSDRFDGPWIPTYHCKNPNWFDGS